MGAEIIGAEKGTEKIAIEIKSFSGASDVDEFEDALGQFLLYKLALLEKESARQIFLAMPSDFYKGLFDDAFFQQVLKVYQVHLLIYNIKLNAIEEWIN